VVIGVIISDTHMNILFQNEQSRCRKCKISEAMDFQCCHELINDCGIKILFLIPSIISKNGREDRNTTRVEILNPTSRDESKDSYTSLLLSETVNGNEEQILHQKQISASSSSRKQHRATFNYRDLNSQLTEASSV
jgi:hypothetical protein